MKWEFTVFLLGLTAWGVTHVVNRSDETRREERRSAYEARASALQTSKSFEIEPAAEESIIATMKVYGARDAAIAPNGTTINLAFEVPFGTSEAMAKKMGESFLRLVKSQSNDESPGKEVGPGHFTYHVGAFSPDQKWLVQGAKLASARRITW